MKRPYLSRITEATDKKGDPFYKIPNIPFYSSIVGPSLSLPQKKKK